jgi:polysaccharide pyruvyl transferase WcaK-like protein
MSGSLKNIVVLGYYGAGNFGDEIMLRNLVLHLLPSNIRVVAYDLAPLWVEQELPGQVEVVRVHRQGSVMDRLRTNATLTEVILRSDLVIYGGGTFLFDNVERSYRNLIGVLRVVLICQFFAKRFGLIGIGIGELHTFLGQQIARFILRRADIITVRDRESLEDIKTIAGAYSEAKTLQQAADLAFLNSLAQLPIKDVCDRGEKFTIAVCGTEFDYRRGVGRSEDELSTYLAWALDQMIERGIDVRFVPMQSSVLRNDNSFHHRIQSKMKNACSAEIVSDGGEYSAICGELRNANLVVGMRLHSLVVAVSIGTPVLALALSNKVFRFMKKAQLGDYLLQVGQICDSQTLERAISSVIDDIEEAKYPDLDEFVSEQRLLARANIAVLEDFI